jgi:molybdopterin molybdotransferase
MFYTEAQKIILSQAASFGKEEIPLEQAFERVLCETIIADRDYPPFNRAAMDGYALRFEDLEKGIRTYKIKETIYAGQSAATSLAAGECYKIMTGAATPEDAGLIIRREDTREEKEQVTILTEVANRFQNISRRGEDLRQGDIIIDKPVVAAPAVIGLLAAVGKQSVMAEKWPRVALITTGNEVVPVGQQVSAVQIRNSNAWLLRALLWRQNIQPFSIEHLPDEKEKIAQAFKKVLDADIIIASGGVSAGDADFVPEALESLGVQPLFHKVMVRPGKPIWCGKMPRQGMVFALPGNPLSCLVTFQLFVLPYLHACYGLPQPVTPPMTLEGERRKKTALDEFFPVKLVGGATAVRAVPFNGSGDIRAALFADGLARHQRDKAIIATGDKVEFFPF